MLRLIAKNMRYHDSFIGGEGWAFLNQRGVYRTSRTVFVRCSYGVAYGVAYGVRSVRRATYGSNTGATYGVRFLYIQIFIPLAGKYFTPVQ